MNMKRHMIFVGALLGCSGVVLGVDTTNMRLATSFSLNLAHEAETFSLGEPDFNNASFSLELPFDESEDSSLLARQSCRPGYHYCGFCCQNGYDCMSDGTCCPSGTERCGTKCYDPDTSVCCEATNSACPLGWDCQTDGTCCEAGMVRCGDDHCYDPDTSKCCEVSGGSCELDEVCTDEGTCCPSDLPDLCNGRWCYDSDTEICCEGGSEGGSCPGEDTCCEFECCRSIAFCGGDGFCSACPPATRTVTKTATSTTVQVSTTTVDGVEGEEEVPDEDEAPAFECVPMEVENEAGAVLALDEECVLSYEPPPSDGGDEGPEDGGTTSSSVEGTAALRARQASCTPTATVTTTVTTTRPFTTQSTTTRTLTIDPSEEGFTCPEMVVTNAVGDELAMAEDCSLEFTPAEPDTDDSVGDGGDDGSGSAGENTDDGSSLYGAVSSWGAVLVTSLCLALAI